MPDDLESRIESKATDYAKKLGMLTLKINVKGNVGWPDHLYVYNGGVLFIEFKRFKLKPTPLQDHIHKLLRAHHIRVEVADNLLDALTILNKFKEAQDGN